MSVKYRIRKLTPSECYTLMGMNPSDVEKARALSVADSELYKQAGNGIVSNCVELLFERLYKNQVNKNIVTTDMVYARKNKEENIIIQNVSEEKNE